MTSLVIKRLICSQWILSIQQLLNSGRIHREVRWLFTWCFVRQLQERSPCLFLGQCIGRREHLPATWMCLHRPQCYQQYRQNNVKPSFFFSYEGILDCQETVQYTVNLKQIHSTGSPVYRTLDHHFNTFPYMYIEPLKIQSECIILCIYVWMYACIYI